MNPQLIYASTTGFGYNGPYKDEPAYDTLIQALTGMMDLTGFPNSPPMRSAPPFVDISSGVFCTLAIVAALYYRKLAGVGQKIDISMYDVAISNMIGLHSELQGGEPFSQAW